MRFFALIALSALAFSQSRTMTQGAHRMEIKLERLDDNNNWKSVDPALVLSQGDRVRFRFKTNFDGYLYVMNLSSSGKYEQLFPREETGDQNKIAANQEYQVPSNSSRFRIAGPEGYETVYWLVTPARLTEAPPRPAAPPATSPSKPPTLIPRCDDVILQARAQCIDHAAGPRLMARGETLPQNLPPAAAQAPRDLLFLRQQDTSVISSPEPLTGPIIYEFRLAHR
jgi:hypothetical protein